MNLCIAHGGDVSRPTGGTNRVTAFAGGLSEKGYEVTLVVPRPDGELPDRLGNVDVYPVEASVGPMTNPATRAAAVARSALRIANQQNATLQIEHSTLAGTATLFGAQEFVLDMHDLAHSRYDHVDMATAPLLKRVVVTLERRALQRASHVVTVSEQMSDLLTREWTLEPQNITTVPNGYVPETIAPARDVSIVDGRVGFLGTLHPKVDVNAFVDLAEHPLVSEVVVVGDGAQRDILDEFGAKHDGLLITGRLPNREAFRLLASSEVLVNPQEQSKLQQSSSPVKLFYYAAIGRPMVVSAGPTIVEKLVAADAALVADDRNELVAGVERVLREETLATSLADHAISAAEQFRWSDRVTELDRVYDQIGTNGPNGDGGESR